MGDPNHRRKPKVKYGSERRNVKAGLSVETGKSRNTRTIRSSGWSVSRFVSFHNLTKRKGVKNMEFLNKEVHIKYLLDNVKVFYERTNDKTDLFTKEHVKYACSISNEKGTYAFTYQCNPKYCKPTEKSLVACVLSDARCYQDCIVGGEEENMEEFAKMFGYDNIKDLFRAFKGCKEASNQINKMFTKEEQELLYDYFNEKGEI